MKSSYISYTVGDLYTMAQNTVQPNTTDLSGRTAFGWTGVPVVIRVGFEIYEIENAEYVPANDKHEDYIELKFSPAHQ